MKLRNVAILVLWLLAGAFVAPSGAQTISNVRPSTATGTLSDDTCTGTSLAQTGCVGINLGGWSSVALQITGTFSGTITFEVSVDGTNYTTVNMFPAASVTPQTTTSSTGIFYAGIAGNNFRARMSSFSSGTAVITIRATLGSVSQGGGGGGGGGSGTVTSVDLTFPAMGLLSVSGNPITTSGTLAVATSGTSGAIPYFSSTTVMKSSGLMANHGIILGQGAGAAPVTLSPCSTTTVVHGAGAAADPTCAQVANGDLAGSIAASKLVGSDIATVGTITSGTWNGTSIAVLYGGTGTTSATGSAGSVVLSSSPTIVTPTIASFVNAGHNHQNAAGGGTLAEAALALTDITTNNATTSAHGFVPKGDNNAAHFLNGQLGWAAISVADANVTFTDITTGNATSSQHGFMPKMSGNAYDFVLGNGTYGQTVDAGTLTASKPWLFTQTWNNAGVTFSGMEIGVTATAAATASTELLVHHGATNDFCVDFGSSSACATNSGVVATSGQVWANGGTFVPAGSFYTQQNARNFFLKASLTNRFLEEPLDTYTCSGCGMSPTLSGHFGVGSVTLGTAPSATTLTFTTTSLTMQHAPVCNGYDTTTNIPATWASTTTSVTFTGTFTASDVFVWTCQGWR